MVRAWWLAACRAQAPLRQLIDGACECCDLVYGVALDRQAERTAQCPLGYIEP